MQSRPGVEPNPIRGLWYAATSSPQPEAPCYGCRRGWRRAYTKIDGEHDGGRIVHHHLVREGVTIDCVGTAWLIDQIIAEDSLA